MQSSPYIEIIDHEASNGTWDTNNGAKCQIYVTNWTDSSISLVANAPIDASDPINSSLSLLIDVSPDTHTAPGKYLHLPRCRQRCSYVHYYQSADGYLDNLSAGSERRAAKYGAQFA